MGDSFTMAMNDIVKPLVVDSVDHDVEPTKAAWDLIEMIQAFLQAPSYHVIFEVILIIWIIRLILFTKSYKLERTVLTEKEKDELIAEWEPEPLVPTIDPNHPVLQHFENRIIKGKIGKTVNVNGNDCLNMASLNFLGMTANVDIEEASIRSMRKYGVGSCGPRGFYGTVDVHLNLEERLQNFMHCEEAIIYSSGFATIASAIPAYSKRSDVIFADEGVHFAIQKGIQASRSKVHYFKHNDLEDLEKYLKIQEVEDKKNPKKAKVTRRFLVVEGLYLNYADLCPLPQLIALKHKYKVRIFMDESVSFGTLGATGHGVTEHFGIDIDEIDLITSTLEYSMSSIGGFCCGRAYVIDHQRLSGLGYCFSASCPPMLAQSAIEALNILEDHPEMIASLREISRYAHKQLNSIRGAKVVGIPESPIFHVCIASSNNDHQTDMNRLRRIVQIAEDNAIALTVSAYLNEEINIPPPSLRIPVTCLLEPKDIDEMVRVLQMAFDEIND